MRAKVASLASHVKAGAACLLRILLTYVSTLEMKAAFVGGGELRRSKAAGSGPGKARALPTRRSKNAGMTEGRLINFMLNIQPGRYCFGSG